MKLNIRKVTIAAALSLMAFGAAHAQTKLKWAHVYETSEPYHTAAVVGCRRNRQAHQQPLHGRSVPGVDARQGNRHQPGADARHRRHHLYRAVVRGPHVRPDRDRRRAVHVP